MFPNPLARVNIIMRNPELVIHLYIATFSPENTIVAASSLGSRPAGTDIDSIDHHDPNRDSTLATHEPEHSTRHNLLFYQNKLRCRPDRLTIDELHERWQGAYDTLEDRHGFIQWLFPIQENGMNHRSQPLQRHEIETMRSSPEIVQRVIRSYKLMLDFYGMRLLDEKTGLLDRVLPPRTFERRYKNFVQASHNNLRITRILKCLSEMDLEYLNVGFVLHVLNEQSEHKELTTGMLKGSMDRWWANCNRNGEEREWVAEIIHRVRSSGWVFTRDMYEKALRRRDEQGSLGLDDVDVV